MKFLPIDLGIGLFGYLNDTILRTFSGLRLPCYSLKYKINRLLPEYDTCVKNKYLMIAHVPYLYKKTGTY